MTRLIFALVMSIYATPVGQWALNGDTATTTVLATFGPNGTAARNLNLTADTGPGTYLTRGWASNGSSDRITIGAVTGAPFGNAERLLFIRAKPVSFDTGADDLIFLYAPSASAGRYMGIFLEDNSVSVAFTNHRVRTTTTALSTGVFYDIAIAIPNGATLTSHVQVFINAQQQALVDETGSAQTLNTVTPNVYLGGSDVGDQFAAATLSDARIYSVNYAADVSGGVSAFLQAIGSQKNLKRPYLRNQMSAGLQTMAGGLAC